MKVVMKGFDPPASKLYYHWDQAMRRCGDEYITIPNPVSYPLDDGADCYYQTNLLKPKFMDPSRKDWLGNHLQYIQNSGRPYIVSESAVFRKYPVYKRFGWNSYKWDDGNFNNENVGSERWDKFEKKTGIVLKDWKSPGDKIIIMGQKEGDSSLIKLYDQGFNSFYDWVAEVVRTIRKYSDREIVIRPHPRNIERGINYTNKTIESLGLKDVSISKNLTLNGAAQGGKELDRDMQDAYCVITYNSLSGVESVCEGIPTFALDSGSMVWPVTHHDLSTIENLDNNFDMQSWKNRVAYTFWNKEEVSSGECWMHLKPVYFK